MKTAINQVFIEEEPESGGFKAQMRVLEEEKQREEDLQNIESVIGEELTITHSAQIISLFASSQKTADYLSKMLSGYEDELSVDFISSLIEQGMGQDELEQIIEESLASTSANITKDKSSAKKQMAKIFELLAVLERTVRQNQTQLQKPEQLQSSLRQMQEKVRDLAKGGNVENIQKFLKEGELKTAIKQSVELAAKKPETFRNAADDVAVRIRESQQKATQTQNQQQSQKPDISKQNPEIKENATRQLLSKIMDKGKELLNIDKDAASRAVASQAKLQPQQPQVQQLQQSQITQNASTKFQPSQQIPQVLQNGNLQINSQARNNLMASNPQASQPIVKPISQSQMTSDFSRQVGNVQIPRVEPAISPQAKAAQPAENIVPIKTNNIQPQSVQQTQPIAQTKLESKPEIKPDLKTEPPPTKAHVHSGNCCGAKQEPAKINETVNNMSNDIKRVADQTITPERRAEITDFAKTASKGTEAKYLESTSAKSQQQATAAFGF